MKFKKIILPVLSLGLMSLTLASCGGTDAKDATISSQNEQISTLESEKTTLNSEIATLKDNVSTLEARVAELETSLEKTQNSEDKVIVSELRGQIKTLNATIKSLETAALADKDTISTLETDKDNLTLQVSNLNAQVTNLTNQIQTLTTANKTLTSQKTALETEKAELETQIETYKNSGMTSDEKDAKIISLQTELNDTKSQLTSLQNEYERVSSELASANEQITELQESASQVVSQVAQLVYKFNAFTVDYSFNTNEIYNYLPEGAVTTVDYYNFSPQTIYVKLSDDYSITKIKRFTTGSKLNITVKKYDAEYVANNNIPSLRPVKWDLFKDGAAVYGGCIVEWTVDTYNDCTLLEEAYIGKELDGSDIAYVTEISRYNLPSGALIQDNYSISDNYERNLTKGDTGEVLDEFANRTYYVQRTVVNYSTDEFSPRYVPVTVQVHSQAIATPDADLKNTYLFHTYSSVYSDISKLTLNANTRYTGSFTNYDSAGEEYIAKDSKANCLYNKTYAYETKPSDVEITEEYKIDFSVAGKYYTSSTKDDKNFVVIVNTYFLTIDTNTFIYDASEPTLIYGE
jgi:peptidoglycan hydrolase CwlO-like protein